MAFMTKTIAYKNTLLCMETEFVLILGYKVMKVSTSKYFKEQVIEFLF